jgi:DNA topoisomerase-1
MAGAQGSAMPQRGKVRQFKAGRRAPCSPAVPLPAIAEPVESAKSAGLRYVSDLKPGIRRVRKGKGFSYVGPDGKAIRDRDEIRRIRALVIPPAWTSVWICPDPRGHLQATGRDARGRKQYRYHPRWRQVRDANKYDRMIAFAYALPRIREQTAADLSRPGLPREKVLATVVQLLEKTLIRVGNEEYARANNSFGLTTLRESHVDVQGSTIRFAFRGKGGIEHEVGVSDRRLAAIVRKVMDLPGQELFQYMNGDGVRQTIDSADVNDYIRQLAADEFTAKDFRTWAGTVLAAQALRGAGFQSGAQAKRNVVRAIDSVAARLRNTRAVCRKCYIHPAVLDAYLDGTLRRALTRRADQPRATEVASLDPDEAAVLGLLQQRLKADQGSRRSKVA